MEIPKRLDFKYSNVLFVFWSVLVLGLIFLVNIKYIKTMPLDLLIITNGYFIIALCIIIYMVYKYRRIYKYSNKIIIKPLLSNIETEISESDALIEPTRLFFLNNPLSKKITNLKLKKTFLFFPSLDTNRGKI